MNPDHLTAPHAPLSSQISFLFFFLSLFTRRLSDDVLISLIYKLVLAFQIQASQ